MRILVAGATGVLGQATLPHLEGHDVLGLTRAVGKLRLLQALGAEGVVCDVYDAEELIRLAQERRPHVVVNFVTDLSAGTGEANSRARREGGRNLVRAAEAAGSRRLILESVAFPLERPAAEALGQMEQTALESPIEVLILQFGRLWGPATFYQEPPDPPAIHIDDAGTRAADLITSGLAGTYVLASPAGVARRYRPDTGWEMTVVSTPRTGGESAASNADVWRRRRSRRGRN